MSRTIGSGDVERFEEQAEGKRHLAGELQRDLDTWREHLPPATIAEVTGRIARHLAEAREFEAIVLRSRRTDGRTMSAHFAEAGDELGHRVGG